MTVDGRDLRLAIVAFQDVATWCEALADLADRLIASAREARPLPAPELASAAEQVAETRRFLESNGREVARLRQRAGIV